MSVEEYTKDELSRLSNPKIIGPGGWMTLHKLARYDDMNGQKTYPGFIRNFCADFNCSTCRPHCIDNCVKDPPEQYIGQTWGMSWHSFNFHNRANKALGKKIMSWKQYARIYLNDDPNKGIVFCSGGCGNAYDDKKSGGESGEKGKEKEKEKEKGKEKGEVLDADSFNELIKVSKRDSDLVRIKSKNKKRGDGKVRLI